MNGDYGRLVLIFKCYIEPASIFVFSIYTAICTSLSLFIYFSRTVDASHFGMIFMLLATHLLYCFLNLIGYSYYLFPESLQSYIYQKNVIWFMFFQFAPQMARQVVSVSSALLAVDRVLVMNMPVTYSFNRISVKLAALAAALNGSAIFIFLCSIFVLPGEVVAIQMFTVLRIYIFCPTLVIEVFLYALFLVQFRWYMKGRTSLVARQLTSKRNHILLFQMICHTLFCAIPTTAITLNYHLQASGGSETTWTELYVEPFKFSLFAISVVLSSTFTLYKFRPTKQIIKVAATGSLASSFQRKTPPQ